MAQENRLRILTAEDIWAAKDIEERVVEVPQWGGSVRIRTLSQKQASTLRRQASRMNMVTKQSEIDNELLEALLFTEGVIEPKLTMADYGRLQEKSMSAMSAILKEIMDASGLTEAAVQDATKSIAEESDAEVRVSDGAGTWNDTRGIAYSNER